MPKLTFCFKNNFLSKLLIASLLTVLISICSLSATRSKPTDKLQKIRTIVQNLRIPDMGENLSSEKSVVSTFSNPEISLEIKVLLKFLWENTDSEWFENFTLLDNMKTFFQHLTKVFKTSETSSLGKDFAKLYKFLKNKGDQEVALETFLSNIYELKTDAEAGTRLKAIASQPLPISLLGNIPIQAVISSLRKILGETVPLEIVVKKKDGSDMYSGPSTSKNLIPKVIQGMKGKSRVGFLLINHLESQHWSLAAILSDNKSAPTKYELAHFDSKYPMDDSLTEDQKTTYGVEKYKAEYTAIIKSLKKDFDSIVKGKQTSLIVISNKPIQVADYCGWSVIWAVKKIKEKMDRADFSLTVDPSTAPKTIQKYAGFTSKMGIRIIDLITAWGRDELGMDTVEITLGNIFETNTGKLLSLPQLKSANFTLPNIPHFVKSMFNLNPKAREKLNREVLSKLQTSSDPELETYIKYYTYGSLCYNLYEAVNSKERFIDYAKNSFRKKIKKIFKKIAVFFSQKYKDFDLSTEGKLISSTLHILFAEKTEDNIQGLISYIRSKYDNNAPGISARDYIINLLAQVVQKFIENKLPAENKAGYQLFPLVISQIIIHDDFTNGVFGIENLKLVMQTIIRLEKFTKLSRLRYELENIDESSETNPIGKTVARITGKALRILNHKYFTSFNKLLRHEKTPKLKDKGSKQSKGFKLTPGNIKKIPTTAAMNKLLGSIDTIMKQKASGTKISREAFITFEKNSVELIKTIKPLLKYSSGGKTHYYNPEKHTPRREGISGKVLIARQIQHKLNAIISPTRTLQETGSQKYPGIFKLGSFLNRPIQDADPYKLLYKLMGDLEKFINDNLDKKKITLYKKISTWKKEIMKILDSLTSLDAGAHPEDQSSLIPLTDKSRRALEQSASLTPLTKPEQLGLIQAWKAATTSSSPTAIPSVLRSLKDFLPTHKPRKSTSKTLMQIQSKVTKALTLATTEAQSAAISALTQAQPMDLIQLRPETLTKFAATASRLLMVQSQQTREQLFKANPQLPAFLSLLEASRTMNTPASELSPAMHKTLTLADNTLKRLLAGPSKNVQPLLREIVDTRSKTSYYQFKIRRQSQIYAFTFTKDLLRLALVYFSLIHGYGVQMDISSLAELLASVPRNTSQRSARTPNLLISPKIIAPLLLAPPTSASDTPGSTTLVPFTQKPQQQGTQRPADGQLPNLPSLAKLKELAKLAKPAGVSYNQKGLANTYYEYIIQLAVSKFANSFKMQDDILTYNKKILPYTKSLIEGLKGRSVKRMRAALAAMVEVCS